MDLFFALVARRKGGQDDYVTQSFRNYIDRLGLVKAELKCDQEPSTLDVANASIKRCQSTALIVTATPKGWRTSEFDDSGIIRLNEIQDRSWTGSCVDGLDGTTLCMGCKQFQVMGTGRTPYRSIRCKDYTGEVVPFGEICLGRNHSEDGAKLNMRWMRGVFVGKLDRTDEFLLLTPTGAMNTRCVRHLEGDNALGLAIFESVFWQSVECDSKEHAADTNSPTKG